MENWKPSKILYFVDVRQQLHLQQVFEISRLVGWVSPKTDLFHAYN
jgi:arginyl-tRNA synthetase